MRLSGLICCIQTDYPGVIGLTYKKKSRNYLNISPTTTCVSNMIAELKRLLFEI